MKSVNTSQEKKYQLTLWRELTNQISEALITKDAFEALPVEISEQFVVLKNKLMGLTDKLFDTIQQSANMSGFDANFL